MAEVAGYWLVAVAAIHLLYSMNWVEHGGFRRTVSPPWEDESMRLQRDFWSQIGSFAVPFGLLGGLVIWTAHRHRAGGAANPRPRDLIGWPRLVAPGRVPSKPFRDRTSGSDH